MTINSNRIRIFIYLVNSIPHMSWKDNNTDKMLVPLVVTIIAIGVIALAYLGIPNGNSLMVLFLVGVLYVGISLLIFFKVSRKES